MGGRSCGAASSDNATPSDARALLRSAPASGYVHHSDAPLQTDVCRSLTLRGPRRQVPEPDGPLRQQRPPVSTLCVCVGMWSEGGRAFALCSDSSEPIHCLRITARRTQPLNYLLLLENGSRTTTVQIVDGVVVVCTNPFPLRRDLPFPPLLVLKETDETR